MNVPLPRRKVVTFPIHNLVDEIAAKGNVEASFDYVVSHLEHKRQREHYKKKREVYCEALCELLSKGEFRITDEDFHQIGVKDGPKFRIVQCPKVFHRVGCNAVTTIFEKYTYPTLITNTAASIKGRGMHWLHQILEDDLLADPEHMQVYYQSDIYHYYDSIGQDLAKADVREYTDDEKALMMLDNFITLLPRERGISKGLRFSQCLSNLHLSDIDHKMCERVSYHEIDDPKIADGKGVAVSGEGMVKIKGKTIRYHYYRYCDDIVIFAATKKELWQLRDYLVELLSEKMLKIKPSEAVRPATCGLDYLGYNTYLTEEEKPDGTIVYGCYSRIRKRTKQKFARRIKEVKSRRRRQELIVSFFGMAAHADCRHLLRKLITPKEFNNLKHKRKMNDFGDFKLSPSTLDGKKNFRGNRILPRELQGQGFIVYDFERGVVARRDKDDYKRRLQDAAMRSVTADLVDKPKEKYVLQVIYHSDLQEVWKNRITLSDALYRIKRNGELQTLLRKMWTGDRDIWHSLDELEECGEIPFFVAVDMDYSGQYPKARFVSASNFGMRVPSDEEETLLLTTLNLK